MKKCPKCGNEHEKKGKFCSRSCANSRTWSESDKKKKSESAKKSDKVIKANRKIAENNKGGDNVILTCGVCDNKFEVVYSNRNRKYCSKECLDKDWANINKNSGGIRKGSGRGKKGWYKGYWCDSSWELAWVIYHLEHDIPFDRNTEGFEYMYEGKKLKYYPDFIKEGVYYEIKGYMTEKTKHKIDQFKKELVVLFRDDMKKILDYTISKYGSDFIRLYESKIT